MSFCNCCIVHEYVSLIKLMERARTQNVQVYGYLESKRREIHDKILIKYATNRDNYSFSYRLASFVESQLDDSIE